MRARRDAAFTLVELLVAAALMAVVVLYLMQTFTVQHRTYTVVEQVTEAHQNERAIAGLIESEVRAAGFMVPEGAAVCAVDNTNAPDVLYVSAADILDPSGIDEPDVRVGINPADAGWRQGEALATTIRLDNPVIPDGDGPAFDLDSPPDGTNDADFVQGMGLIVTNVAATNEGTACGRITADPVIVAGPQLQVQVEWDVQMQVPAGGTDYAVVPAHVYDLNGTNLRRDGTLLAPEVEDLQVALFYDNDDDGQDEGDGSEWPGSAAGQVYDPGSGAWLGAALRDVRVNFVVRSRGEDPNQQFNQGRFQDTENRVGPAGADGFRRRVHTATVRLRNVGFRDLQ